MPLLRRVRPTEWNPSQPLPQAELTKMLGQFALDKDESGLSMWAVDDDESLNVVLAGLACGWAKHNSLSGQNYKSPGAIVVLEIDNDLVLRDGPITAMPGTAITPLTRSHPYHVELQWPQPKLDSLAKCLGEVLQMKATRYVPSRVIQALWTIALDDLEPSETDLRSWLAKVHSKRPTGP
jgi:hypothetical protein